MRFTISPRSNRRCRALLAMAVAVVAAVGAAGPAGAATAPQIADVTDGTSNTLAFSECAAFSPAFRGGVSLVLPSIGSLAISSAEADPAGHRVTVTVDPSEDAARVRAALAQSRFATATLVTRQASYVLTDTLISSYLTADGPRLQIDFCKTDKTGPLET